MSLYKWVIPFFLLSPPVFLLLQSNLGVWLTTPCPAWLLNWASLCWQENIISHEHWRHECSSDNIAQKWKESCSCPFCSWKRFFFSVGVGGLLLWSYIQANSSSTQLENVLIFGHVVRLHTAITRFRVAGGEKYVSPSSLATNPPSL